jgi:hypothetical protein
MPSRNTDVPAPHGGYNVNWCDTDVSHSSRLCPQVHRHVHLSSIPLFSCAHCVVDDCSTFENLQQSDNRVSRTKSDSSAPIPLNRIEVAEDTCERHPTAQTIISVDGQLGGTKNEPSLDSDLERAMEN